MCVDAIANDQCVSTQGELAKALGVGVEDLVIHKCYRDREGNETGRDPQCCLCPIDAEETANKLGWKVIFHKWDDTHSGEVEFTK